jgi:hypothetical protein
MTAELSTKIDWHKAQGENPGDSCTWLWLFSAAQQVSGSCEKNEATNDLFETHFSVGKRPCYSLETPEWTRSLLSHNFIYYSS